jgi:hypothetical protein
MPVISRRWFIAMAATSIGAAQIPRKEVGMEELRMQTRLERVNDFLALHYEVESHSTRDAYLLNRINDLSLQTTPDLIYIELDHGRRLVRAYKKIPDIPPGMSPTMPIAPYVTPLRAGQKFNEVVRIRLPVREYLAYTAVPTEGRTVAYAGLTFTLGYYWSVPGMKERVQQIVPGVEVLIPTPPPAVHIEFADLSSHVMQLEFPVVETG